MMTFKKSLFAVLCFSSINTCQSSEFMNAVSDYGLDSIAALTCIASTINTLRNPTVSPRGIIKIATMLLSGGYLATKYKELIINTFFLDWRLQAGAVPAKNIPGIKKYFRKLETTAEREAFLQDLKNFPFHSPEQFPEQDMLSVAAELQKNPALFQANISQIVNTLSLNQKVLPLEKKTLVLSCPKSHPAVKIAKEIAHALGKPYAVIDFAKNQWRNSLLGRTDMGRGEPGRLFKAFTQTKTPSCVLIFKNTHNLSEEEAFTLINCLTQKDSPVIDRNTDIEIPFKHATTIFINEKNHLSANFFFKYDAFFTNILFNDYVLDERRQIIEKNIIPSIIKKYSLEEPVIKTLLEHATGLALAWQNSNQSFKCCKTAIRKLTFGLFINPPETPLSQDQLTSFFKEYEILEDALTPEIPERLQQSIKIKMSDAIANGNLYKYYIEQYPFRKELIPFIRREAISHAFEEKIVGLEAKKQEVLTLLISNTLSAPIHKKGICFVGMAGTGKTNFAHALADATERKKYVIDFNSMANLPGDPTNIAGAEPSDFFKAFCQTQSRAPAIILDNIDKASKLNMVFLEKALNPTKNHAYLDQFSGFEMDLSNVFFILTAKDLSEIPSSMLEHLEIINLSGYSFNEKMEIAALSLLPNALQGRAISIAQLEAAYRDIVSCISSLCNLIAPNEKGLHQISRAINSLVLQEVVSLVANNKPLGLTPENLSSFIPPVLSEHTLNPADDINAYCNDVIRSLKITPEEFKKIENHIIALKPWKGGNSITLLYMEWIRKFPFNTYAPEQKSLEFARQQLDSTHFGLEQVKNLILDHLAGSFLATEKGVSKNICFIGGPGIGKTTFAESIAKALNRPFVRVPVESIKSLTGVVGEHEMFGEGPGALGKAVCNTGCLNPVILLDEIDKACPNVQYQLLEILDPAQNKNIKDGFLGLDIDASKILFIASANDLSNLSHALRDRLHKVELSPYGKAERVGIAQHMIVPDILKEFHFPPEVAGYLYELVDELVETTLKTEYGVRNLKRFLYIAANKYARLIIEQKPLIKLSVIDILKDQYPDLLQFKNNPATIPATTPVIGVVNGMYAGGADGGGIHKTQASIIPGGSGNLIKNELGGQTAQASQQQTLMFVKSFASKYNIDPEIFKNADFAIVKQHYDEFDGPSAGIAQTVALISALTKRAVKPGYAVTGAIDALGNLLPVGGYREKILGTTRTGITNFIVPECARETMEALKSQFVGLNIILVKTIDEVLDILLEK